MLFIFDLGRQFYISILSRFISLSNYYDIQGFELYNGLKQISQGDKFDILAQHTFITINANELKTYEDDFKFHLK